MILETFGFVQHELKEKNRQPRQQHPYTLIIDHRTERGPDACEVGTRTFGGINLSTRFHGHNVHPRVNVTVPSLFSGRRKRRPVRPASVLGSPTNGQEQRQ